jgi:hypothetical protein
MLTHSQKDSLNFRTVCVWRKGSQGEWAHFNSVYNRKEKIKEELVLKMSKYENLMGRKRENRAVSNAKIKELDPDMSM